MSLLYSISKMAKLTKTVLSILLIAITFQCTDSVDPIDPITSISKINLTNDTLLENNLKNTFIGIVYTNDSALANAFFEIIQETTTNDTLFTLTEDSLFTNQRFDFETQSQYTIIIQASNTFSTITDTLTLYIQDVDESITITSNTILENEPNGTIVGIINTFNKNSQTVFHLTNLSDTNFFYISNDILLTKAPLDYETKRDYIISIQALNLTDTLEQNLTINVLDINEPPTDIQLTGDGAAFVENITSGTVINTIEAIDDDANNTHMFVFVDGVGSTDNASFEIEGNTLKTKTAIDFETQSEYEIRIEATDQDGAKFERQFVLSVNGVNDDPTDILLSNHRVTENISAGWFIGKFNTIDEDDSLFTYTITNSDSVYFTIQGDSLLTDSVLNFEVISVFSLSLLSNDGNGGTVNKEFSIEVVDSNDLPFFSLSDTVFEENTVVEKIILQGFDEDLPEQNLSYSLVSGEGSTDNVSFTIQGDTLISDAAFDYETAPQYTLRIQLSDGIDSVSKSVRIEITNAPIATALNLSADTVTEDLPVGTFIGVLSTDIQNAIFSLSPLSSNPDNVYLRVSTDSVFTDSVLNFENRNSLQVGFDVENVDGMAYSSMFQIYVRDTSYLELSNIQNIFSEYETQLSGVQIGIFEHERDESVTFSSSEGNEDNSYFRLDGDTLRTASILDYEDKSIYRILVEVSGSTSLTKTYEVSVRDTSFGLSSDTVLENQPIGRVVGIVDTFELSGLNFSLVSGDSSDHNVYFRIDGDTLKTDSMLDYESDDSVLLVRIGSGEVSKGFAISLKNELGWVRSISNAPFNKSSFGALVFEEQIWLVHGSGGRFIYSSRDGFNWQQRADLESNILFGAFSNFRDTLFAIGGLFHPSIVSFSIDGINWTGQANSTLGSFFGEGVAVFKDTLWYLVSGSNVMFKSGDGLNWDTAASSINLPSRTFYEMIVFNNKLWVLGGFANSSYFNDIWSSNDGVTWIKEVDSAPWLSRSNFSSVVFDNKLWIMGGNYNPDNALNDVWSSSDGVTWTEETDSAPWLSRNNFSSVVFDNRMWVIGGGRRDAWYYEKE